MMEKPRRRRKKWYEYYETEEDLINDMLCTNTDNSKDIWKCVKEYSYIRAAKLYYYLHGELTSEMLAHIKKLGEDIYFNVHYEKRINCGVPTYFIPIMNVSDYIKGNNDRDKKDGVEDEES